MKFLKDGVLTVALLKKVFHTYRKCFYCVSLLKNSPGWFVQLSKKFVKLISFIFQTDHFISFYAIVGERKTFDINMYGSPLKLVGLHTCICGIIDESTESKILKASCAGRGIYLYF